MIVINRKKFLILISFFLIFLSSLHFTCYAAESSTESSFSVTFNTPLPHESDCNNYMIYRYDGSYYAYTYPSFVDVYSTGPFHCYHPGRYTYDLWTTFVYSGYPVGAPASERDEFIASHPDCANDFNVYKYSYDSDTGKWLQVDVDSIANYTSYFFSFGSSYPDDYSIIYSSSNVLYSEFNDGSFSFNDDVFFSRKTAPQMDMNYWTVTKDSLSLVLNGIHQLIPIVLPIVIALVAFWIGYRLLVTSLRDC